MMKNRIAELIFCNDRFRIISHYLLPPTVVKHPDFYYHFTTIDGIDLPHFAVFAFSVTESQIINNFFCLANRGKLRQNTAFHTESVPLGRRLIAFD